MNCDYYPAFVRLAGRRCVVVGGGAVAERKILALLCAGAEVTVVSPTLTARLLRKARSGEIVHRARTYRKGDLRDAFLVIAATSDERVNERVNDDAGCLINVVDRPEYGNFIAPSVIRRGPLTIAVSTSGRSPALARSIRRELEELYGVGFGGFLRLLEKLRRQVRDEVKSGAERSRLLKKVASPEVISVLRAKGPRAARRMVRALVETHLRALRRPGA